MSDTEQEFAFEVGNLVQVNPHAYDEQIDGWYEIAIDCEKRLFPITDRKVHEYESGGEQRSVIWYKLEGLDYQGSNGWIAEAWLTRYEKGKLTLTVTLPSAGKTEEEIDADIARFMEQLGDICERNGIPRDAFKLVDKFVVEDGV